MNSKAVQAQGPTNGRPFLLGISGGTGAGKSSAARIIMELVHPKACAVINTDSYYHDLSHLPPEELEDYNFDRPEALELELLADHLATLKAGRPAEVPDYDFSRHARRPGRIALPPQPLVIVEGLFILTVEPLRQQLDYSVFMDAPDNIRFIRRLQRDVSERGRTADQVVHRYLRHCRPMHQRHVEPGRRTADLVISGENISAESLAPALEKIARL